MVVRSCPAGSGVPARVLPAGVLVPQGVGLLLSLSPGLVAVQVAETPALEVLLNLCHRESGQQLFAELVVLDDAFALAVVLVHPHRLEARRARQQFVGHLVVRRPATIDLIVRAFGAEHVKESHSRNLAERARYKYRKRNQPAGGRAGRTQIWRLSRPPGGPRSWL